MSHDANTPAPAFDWEDPHAFHHDTEGEEHHEEHHVTSWQRLAVILVLLLILTALTVFAATAEGWAVGMGVNISNFWNVIIAFSIATVKATMVCMYFMHLRHDNPLNSMILLVTLFAFGLFLMFTMLDVGSRDSINPFKAQVQIVGGTGKGMVRGGSDLGANMTTARKDDLIEAMAIDIAAAHDRAEPNDEDQAEATRAFWFDFYHHKFEDHPAHIPPRDRADGGDIHAAWLAHHIETHGDHHFSNASHSRPRRGLTPGLFDTHDPHDAGHDGHEPTGHETTGHEEAGTGEAHGSGDHAVPAQKDDGEH